MKDLRVTSVSRILTVTELQLVDGPPRMLAVFGQNMHYATQVLINDRPSEFIGISAQKLLAQIPNLPDGQPITRVLVTTDIPALNQASIVKFEVGPAFRAMNGFDSTVQLFIKLAITTPGTNRFKPASGGGLLGLIGIPLTEDTKSAVQAMAVNSVIKARDEIISIQGKNNRLSNDERLAGAEVESIGIDVAGGSIPIVAALRSVSGRRVLAGLEI